MDLEPKCKTVNELTDEERDELHADLRRYIRRHALHTIVSSTLSMLLLEEKLPGPKSYKEQLEMAKKYVECFLFDPVDADQDNTYYLRKSVGILREIMDQGVWDLDWYRYMFDALARLDQAGDNREELLLYAARRLCPHWYFCPLVQPFSEEEESYAALCAEWHKVGVSSSMFALNAKLRDKQRQELQKPVSIQAKKEFKTKVQRRNCDLHFGGA